jgi:hypothetical protein
MPKTSGAGAPNMPSYLKTKLWKLLDDLGGAGTLPRMRVRSESSGATRSRSSVFCAASERR